MFIHQSSSPENPSTLMRTAPSKLTRAPLHFHRRDIAEDHKLPIVMEVACVLFSMVMAVAAKEGGLVNDSNVEWKCLAAVGLFPRSG